MKFNSDQGFILSTGRKLYSLCDRLSLNERGELAHGYDSYVAEIDDRNNEFEVDEDKRIPLTPDEKREIAEYEIARWRWWAALNDEVTR